MVIDMKKVLKVCCAALISVFAVQGLSAVDIEAGGSFRYMLGGAGHVWHAWDANFKSYMGYLDDLNTAELNGWINVPLRTDGSMGISAQTSLEFEFNQRQKEGIYLDGTADLDLLNFYYKQRNGYKGNFTFYGGRMPMSDKTGVIFNQKCDGLYLGYNSKKIILDVFAGYTGFLNAKTNLIINRTGKNYWRTDDFEEWYSCIKDKYDASGADNVQDFLSSSDGRKLLFKTIPKLLYQWADAYFVSDVAVTFPYCFANQTAYLEGSMFIAMDGPSKTSDDNEYNRFYGTVGLSGPLFFPNLTYALSTTFSSTTYRAMSNLTIASLSYYTGFHDLSFSARGIYASGHGNRCFDEFFGFTSQAISYQRYGPEFTSSIKGGISASIKPIDNFLITVGADRLYSYPDDVIRYAGWQEYGEVKLQCTTDFLVSLKAYKFYAAKSVYDNAGATLSVVLTF